MKRFLLAAAIATSAIIASPAFATDVGVSVSVGQPGFYGRLDIGGFPQPQVIYAQPRIIQRVEVEREPIYLRVPPGHAKHWDKHCREYNACNERVYFVKDDWYNRDYVPRYQEEHHGHGGGDRDDRRDDRHDDHDNDHRGDHGHGHGHDR